jgi:hypothetical protein
MQKQDSTFQPFLFPWIKASVAMFAESLLWGLKYLQKHETMKQATLNLLDPEASEGWSTVIWDVVPLEVQKLNSIRYRTSQKTGSLKVTLTIENSNLEEAMRWRTTRCLMHDDCIILELWYQSLSLLAQQKIIHVVKRCKIEEKQI